MAAITYDTKAYHSMGHLVCYCVFYGPTVLSFVKGHIMVLFSHSFRYCVPCQKFYAGQLSIQWQQNPLYSIIGSTVAHDSTTGLVASYCDKYSDIILYVVTSALACISSVGYSRKVLLSSVHSRCFEGTMYGGTLVIWTEDNAVRFVQGCFAVSAQ